MTNTGKQIHSEQVDAQLQQALVLAEQGDLISSEALYHQILEQMPEHPQALYGLAQLAGAIGDLEVMETLLSQAVGRILDNVNTDQTCLAVNWLTELAEVLFKLNRLADAMACLKQCEDLIRENLKASPDL